MRKVIENQLKIGQTDIPDIQIDLNCRDEIPQLLLGLQFLYSDKQIRNEVFQILTTVLETDVHYPTDINLLLDAIRKIVFLTGRLCGDLGVTEWRQYRHIFKKIKIQFNFVRRLKHSSSKNVLCAWGG